MFVRNPNPVERLQNQNHGGARRACPEFGGGGGEGGVRGRRRGSDGRPCSSPTKCPSRRPPAYMEDDATPSTLHRHRRRSTAAAAPAVRGGRSTTPAERGEHVRRHAQHVRHAVLQARSHHHAQGFHVVGVPHAEERVLMSSCHPPPTGILSGAPSPVLSLNCWPRTLEQGPYSKKKLVDHEIW